MQVVPARISGVRTDADDRPAGTVSEISPGMQLTENENVPPGQRSEDAMTFVIRMRPSVSPPPPIGITTADAVLDGVSRLSAFALLVTAVSWFGTRKG